jgi:hypothetical protein
MQWDAMVTTGSVRSALSKIAEAVCGTTPALIRVVIPSSREPGTYVVALPFGYTAEVYHYLAEQLGVAIPPGGDPLVLTADEASSLVSLACRLPSLGAAVEAAR